MTPDQWLPADQLKLEPNALEAARETKQSLALTAGPGAGKTEMLAQRADFLLRTGTCRYPQRILAISFKVDASANLKERVRRRCGAEMASRFDSHTFHAFGKRLIDHFRPVLTGADALNPDFKIGERRVHLTTIEFRDLVPLAVRILQSSDMARNAVRQTYSHVFLDEFQDCTHDQYELIQCAFHGTEILLTAVGDTKQRIMGWAGALEGIFGDFSTEFGARALNLYQNFRSAPRLRRMQNAMVKVMDPKAAVADAELAGADGRVEVMEFEDNAQEAKRLALEIQSSIENDGIAPEQIAVLVSRQPDIYAAPLMRELDALGLAYRNEQQLQDIATEPAAQLVVDLIRIVYGEREADAYCRVTGLFHFAALDDDTAYEQRIELHRLIDEAKAAVRSDAATPISGSSLRQVISPLLKHVGRERVAGLSADYERGPRLDELIEQTYERLVDLIEDAADVLKGLSRFSGGHAVRILTIHKSKGLEFDTVIMLAVEKETFWGNLDDERSAYFVGISRAKRRLVLSVAEHRARPKDFQKRWDETRHRHVEFLSYALKTS
ncbi:MAG: UvrD-helicase domain-containing protein [Candidatus Binataceae bacterium]